MLKDTVHCISFSSRPLLKKLVMSAMGDATPPLIPLQPFLNIPGGPLLVSMEGHRDTVSCVAATTITTATGGWNTTEKLSLCIVSSSYDGSLKSWDLETTGVLKTFDGHTDKVLSVALSSDGQYAVSGSADTTVRSAQTCVSLYCNYIQPMLSSKHVLTAVYFSSKLALFCSD